MPEHLYGPSDEGGSAAGLILGILIGVLVIAVLFFFLVFPRPLGRSQSAASTPAAIVQPENTK